MSPFEPHDWPLRPSPAASEPRASMGSPILLRTFRRLSTCSDLVCFGQPTKTGDSGRDWGGVGCTPGVPVCTLATSPPARLFKGLTSLCFMGLLHRIYLISIFPFLVAYPISSILYCIKFGSQHIAWREAIRSTRLAHMLSGETCAWYSLWHKV